MKIEKLETQKRNNDQFVVFGGNSNSPLVESICSFLKVEMGRIKLNICSSSETSFELLESVRGKNVYLIQTGSEPINQNIMELLIMVHSCKLSSANTITTILPYFPYCRQDQTKNRRVSITSKLVADLLKTSGANRVITVDLHSPQSEGFFNIPIDNLSCRLLFVKYIKENIEDYKNIVLVSPDAGGVKRVSSIAEELNVSFAIVHKRKIGVGNGKIMTIIGDVSKRKVVILDDIANTCDTIIMAASKLKEEGASYVYAMCVHGIFSGNAAEKIKMSSIDCLIATNSLHRPNISNECEKIRILDISALVGESIKVNENCHFD